MPQVQAACANKLSFNEPSQPTKASNVFERQAGIKISSTRYLVDDNLARILFQAKVLLFLISVPLKKKKNKRKPYHISEGREQPGTEDLVQLHPKALIDF